MSERDLWSPTERVCRSAPVVVGISGAGNVHVLTFAGEVAEPTRSPIVVVHVANPRAVSVGALGFVAVMYSENPEAVLFPSVVEALARFDVRWSITTERGDPATALNRVADAVGARAIVVGSRPLGWTRRLRRLIGHSVSERVSRRANVPVYVVPRGTSRRPRSRA